MRKDRVRIWGVVAVFVVALAVASVVELNRSYRSIIRMAYTETDLSGFLVAEWIAESFEGIEFILKDSLYGLDGAKIHSSARREQANRSLNERLSYKAAQYENILFLGTFDPECVIQNGSIAEILGKSSAALGREYCNTVFEPPVAKLKLSEFFLSSTGDMNVSATYPLLSDGDRKVVGFALAGLDLSFFQRWLDDIGDPAITISIMDFRQVLLARKPAGSNIGNYVRDAALKDFIQSDKESELFRRVSPVDDINRLWSLRKIRDLPLVVAVGYAIDDVLDPWRAKILPYILGNTLLIIVTVLLAVAYQKNSRNAKTMESLAMVDSLTGLMNRRSFNDIARARYKAAKQDRTSASLVMIDVDHFKAINDTHGHEMGDRILRDIAETIRSSFRSNDLSCRWGGEEFVVYLTDTDPEAARVFAERLRALIEGTVFHDDIRVTISQGIAGLDEGDSFEAMARRADEKLYRAKAEGRNRVVA